MDLSRCSIGCLFEGETAAIVAGFFAHQSVFVPWQAYAATALGAFGGDTMFFLTGRYFSDHALVRRMRSKPGFSHAYEFVQSHPNTFVFSNRYVYGMRLLGGIVAGLSNISFPRFACINALSSLLWAALFVGAGIFLRVGRGKAAWRDAAETSSPADCFGHRSSHADRRSLCGAAVAEEAKREGRLARSVRELVLATVEQQRDHQILLIVEVTRKHPDQPFVLGCVGISAMAAIAVAAMQNAQKGVGGLGIALQRLVDQMMVGVEEIEATLEARLGLSKQRKIVRILDLMVAIEFTKKGLQPGCEAMREIQSTRTALSIVGDNAGQEPAHLAKHGVALQPEGAGAADVQLAGPHLARIFFHQQPKFGRQAGARLKAVSVVNHPTKTGEPETTSAIAKPQTPRTRIMAISTASDPQSFASWISLLNSRE